MKIEQLCHAVEVARTGSIRQAASNLFLSQPNISVSIQNLEREIGFPIFHRGSRGMVPTEKGKVFLDSAEAVVTQFQQLAQFNKDSEISQAKSFSVAILPYRYLVETTAALFRKHNDSPIHLTIKDGNRASVIEMVHKGECELGILGIYSPYVDKTLQQLQAKGIRFVRLGEIKICILVGKQSPLYQLPGNTITREQLRNRCFVGFDEMEFGPYSSMPRLLQLDEDFCPHRIYASSWNVIMDIIRNTDSFTIVATNRKAYAKIPYYEGTRSIELADCDLYNLVGWITKENHPLSTLALEYLNILSEYF